MPRAKRARIHASKVHQIELPNLPMVFPYRKPTFFLRDCYEKYYNMVMDLLDNEGQRFVTITGSPGIGKSLGYLYFVPKYRRERGGVVVTASFTNERQLIKCCVYYPDRDDPEMLTSIPIIRGAMYIYDGTPISKPPDDDRMICFTSTNRSWSRYIRKESLHVELHMPLWSESELLEANDALELMIPPEEIKRRFDLFGGIARACLETNVRNLRRMEKALLDSISKLTLKVVEGFIDRRSNSYHLCHRIFQYHPLESDASQYVIGICSQQVEDKVLEIIRKDEKRFGDSWIRK